MLNLWLVIGKDGTEFFGGAFGCLISVGVIGERIGGFLCLLIGGDYLFCCRLLSNFVIST